MKCSLVFNAVLFLAIVLGISMPAWAYSGGDGTVSNPYRIATADDLILLGETIEDYDKYFIMTADIDLASKGTFTQAVIAGSSGTGSSFDITIFAGNFDGNGHIISNLKVSGGNFCGLFGYIGSGGIITNLGLENVSVSGSDSVGGLCGENDGTITNSYATGSVSGTASVGGLCGRNYGTITSSYATGSVSGFSSIGGLCGYNNKLGTITNSYATGSVSGTASVGGLCGGNYGTITSSYATGSVSGRGFQSVGGLCGSNRGTITSSYATGNVSESHFVGGLCGYNYGTITSSYATGSVSGSSIVGGLCGYNEDGTITGSYATGSVSGGRYVGGLCGHNVGGTITSSFWNTETSGLLLSDGGWGLSDNQMKQSASFYGWTDGSWKIDNDNDYPRLIWENTSGTIINTDYPAATYAGDGTPTSPFEITSAQDLLTLMYRVQDQDKYIVLTTDIDLAGYVFKNSILGYVNVFTGNFNGNGHIISNLTINGIYHCGLFKYIGSGGVVANLGLENISVSGGSFVGGLCGINSGTITGSYASASVSGNSYVGGLCGYNWYGTITSSYATGIVSGDAWVGGLCGGNYGGTITSSYATGNVSGNDWVGGLCGENGDTITSSYATGNVSGGSYVGGLCGNIEGGTITSSYATGSVSGDNSAGGLCGDNWYGTITSSYATGSVSGNIYVGGLCGRNDGTITSSFWDVQTSGIGSSGSNNYGAIGKTTAQMQTLGTFTGAGWDFFGETANGTENIWYMLNSDYPRLAWDVLIPGDIAGGWGVDMADLEVLASNWLDSGIGDINPDGIVNMLDFAIIAKNWLATN